MTRIILYLKGEPFQEIEIDLVEFPKNTYFYNQKLDYQKIVDTRKYQVDANIQQLKAMYAKQIQKVNYDHYVVVVFQSKME